MDPYVYEGTNVLINKMNIQNEQALIDVEAQLFIANVLNLPSIIHQIDFRTHESVQTMHRRLFQELSIWAGGHRIVNIYK